MKAFGGGEMSEKELVSMAKNGDINAFCTLYGKYKSKLYSYAYYRLADRDDAEDAVQNCVLTAFEQIGKLRREEAFSAWIFRILSCACAGGVKEQIRRRNTDAIENADFLTLFEDNTAERQELRQALDVLSDEERNIVLLAVVGGLKSKEIAKISGLTAGGVRSKLSRSLAKMKSEFI